MAERRHKVREAYESMGIDRHELARLTGINPSTITNVVAGAPLGRVKAARIGQIIGWTADEVLRGDRELDREPKHESEPTHPPSKPDSASAA